MNSDVFSAKLQAMAEEKDLLFGVADSLMGFIPRLLVFVEAAVEVPPSTPTASTGFAIRREPGLPPATQAAIRNIMPLVYRMVGWLNDYGPDGSTFVMGWRDVDSCGSMDVDPSLVSPATELLCLTLASHGLYCIEDSPKSRFAYTAKEDLRGRLREMVTSIRGLSQEDDKRASTGITVFYKMLPLTSESRPAEGALLRSCVIFVVSWIIIIAFVVTRPAHVSSCARSHDVPPLSFDLCIAVCCTDPAPKIPVVDGIPFSGEGHSFGSSSDGSDDDSTARFGKPRSTKHHGGAGRGRRGTGHATGGTRPDRGVDQSRSDFRAAAPEPASEARHTTLSGPRRIGDSPCVVV
jgi:hypothetical protein